MALNPLDSTNLHFNFGIPELVSQRTQQPATNYQEGRNNFIKSKENAPLFVSDGGLNSAGDESSFIHDGGGDGNPTIGYGFNLSAQTYNKIEAFLTHAFGGSLNSDQQAGLQIIQDFKTGQISKTQVIEIAQGRQGTAQQIQALQGLQLNNAQATVLLNAELDGFGGFDGRDSVSLTNKLGSGNLDQSLERIAVLSADYQGLLGPGLRGALQSSDLTNRAEAWFQIRYGHINFNVQGLQNRHAEESRIFGLTSNNQDANQKLQETKIAIGYLFSGTSTLSGSSIGVYSTIKAHDSLDNFETAIAGEMATLQSAFTNGNVVDFVQTDQAGKSSVFQPHPDPLGIGQKRDLIFGEDGNDTISGGLGIDFLYGGSGQDEIHGGIENDFLFGEADEDFLDGGAGDDTLEGGTENDVLVGGADNDLLKGGAGFDIYIHNIGDGQDTIEDSDGAGVLIYDNGALTGGVQRTGDPANTFFSTDPGRRFQYVESGGTLTITDQQNPGESITVLNFHNPDFGITLKDATSFPTGQIPTIDYNNGVGTTTISLPNTDDTPTFSAPLNHIVFGNGGNDWLNLSSSSDQFNHQLFGGLGNDLLEGGAGKDQLFGEDGVDVLNGGGGQDVLEGGAGTDLLRGDSFITDVQGDDVLDGGAGDDSLNGFGGNDLLFGGDGNDTLIGDDVQSNPSRFVGDDYLDGGAGIDELFGGLGNDRLVGGADNDQLYGDNIPAGTQLQVDPLTGTITTVPRPAFFTAAGGNDFLEGGAGDDRLQGDGGDDLLFGGAGNDLMFGDDDFQVNQVTSGNDVMEGGAGDDSMTGGGGDDVLSGGADNDLLFGDDGKDTMSGGAGVDQLQGGMHDDVLSGDDGDDTLFGDAGNDRLFGGQGADSLLGGTGNDTLSGGTDNDVLVGEDGVDLLFGDDGNDQLEGGADADDLHGGAGDDVLLGEAGTDTLFGGAGNDELQGGAEADVLDGGAGSDVLFGGEGNDHLIGADADDTILGEDGNDLLQGGSGDDHLEGGLGQDTYILNIGDGLDFINDAAGENNTVQFGVGVTADSVSLGTGNFLGQTTLLVQYGGPNDGVHIAGLDLNDPSTFDTITNFQFSDGSTVAVSAKIQQGLDLLGTPGNDVLNGGELYPRILGLAGNDQLTGGSIANELDGGEGIDTLFGQAGDDVLLGGLGNDTLDGGSGADTYRFNLGDGFDTVQDTSTEVSTFLFGAGITANDISFGRGGLLGETTLVLRYGEGAEVVHLPTFSPNDPLALDGHLTLQFQDGSTVAPSQVLASGLELIGTAGSDFLSGGETFARIVGLEGDDTLVGGALSNELIGNAGDDFLQGNGGNDFLNGGVGDDFLRGEGGDDIIDPGPGVDLIFGGDGFSSQGLGNDILQFNLGDGDNQVFDFGFYEGEVDTVQMDASLTPNDVSLHRDALDMWITVNGTTDQVRFVGFYSNADFFVANNGIRVAFSDGTVWDSLDLRLMTRTISGTEDADMLEGYTFTWIDEVLEGLGGDDILEGGSGTDILRGGAGDDTYLFNLGDEVDTIEDVSLPGEENKILFGAGISLADLIVTQDQTTLTITIGTEGDAIQLLNFDETGVNGSLVVETLEFSDGTLVNTIDLLSTSGTITGTTGDDVLVGTAGNDTIDALAGNDSLEGLAGDDTVIGGAGDDTYLFNLGDGVDTIQDTAAPGEGNRIKFGTGISLANLTLTENGGSLTVTVGTGGDSIVLNGFDPTNTNGSLVVETLEFADGSQVNLADVLPPTVITAGTTGDDVLTGTGGNDVIDAGDGDDTVNAQAGDDIVLGGAGVDTLNGGTGADYLHGGDDNDALDGGGGSDTLIGGLGDDSILGGPAADILEGGEGNDTLNGEAGDDSITGGNGNDTLIGQGGVDLLDGGDGDDTLDGGTDNDTLIGGAGADSLDAGAGDDILFVDAQDISIDGGPGIDTVNVEGTAGITLDLGVSNVEIVNGNDGDDTLIAGTADNVTLNGNGGNDTLEGGNLADIIDGGTGDDILMGLAGDDQMTGGEGMDTLIGGTGADTLDGGEGDDALDGGGGADTLTGGLGNDSLLGGPGADLLDGGEGNDTINGQGGNDTIIAGLGNDTLIGQNGDDTFQFGTGDGQDIIQESNGTDSVEFGTGLVSLDLVLTQSANDLQIAIHGTTDSITVEDWFTGTGFQTENLVASDGQVLLNSQVDSLIQAMATFSTQTGLSWDEALDQQPQDVAVVLASHWQ